MKLFSVKSHSVILSMIVLLFSISCEQDTESPDSTNTSSFGELTDQAGNVYKTVVIGTQTWMAENLKITRYNDGTNIPLLTDNNQWRFNNTPSYSFYAHDSAQYAPLGTIYNWHVVNTQKLCPTGWHVPSKQEWTTLVDYLGGSAIAGGKLKMKDPSNWNSPNAGATNESGFSAISAGAREFLGTFGENGMFAYWWSSSEYTENNATCCHISASSAMAYIDDNFKSSGLYVRCVKD